MAAATILAQWRPDLLIRLFSQEATVVDVGALFLQLISWNFVAQGIIFTSSSTFQGLGNTKPSLLSSATRLFTFAGPAIWLSVHPNFRIEQVWYLSIATTTLQALVSLLLIRMEFGKRLQPAVVKVQVASA